MATYNPGAGFRTPTRKFGRQKHPITGVVTGHAGDDWPAPMNTPIPAAYDGTVARVAYQYNAAKKTGWGNYVDLTHKVNGQTVLTRYAHMPELSTLKVGDEVKKGDIIGKVGSSGGSTGPHLHFEVRINNEPQNPGTFDWPDGSAPATTTPAWAYPFDGAEAKTVVDSGLYIGVPDKQLGSLGRATSGFYPIGVNSLWHGGIHFDAETNSMLLQKAGVRCIHDGEVVAYLIDKRYPESEFPPGGRKSAYSRGLTLVKHSLKIPEAAKPAEAKKDDAKKGEAKPDDKKPDDKKAVPLPVPRPEQRPADAKPADAKPAEAKPVDKKDEKKKDGDTLVFYSLYIHQLDFKGYEDDKKLSRPKHWGAGRKFKVGEKAKDKQEAGVVTAAAQEPELLFANATNGSCSVGDDDDDDNQVC